MLKGEFLKNSPFCVNFIKLYEYLNYLSNTRQDKPTTRARKIAAKRKMQNY